MRRVLKVVAKVLAWTILSALLLVSALLLISLIAARSEWGHRKLLAKVMPQIEGAIDGKVRIGHLGGNLTSGLILTDIEVDDREGLPVVRARKVSVHYNLLPLLHHTLRIDRLTVEDLWLQARTRKDGRLNVAALLKPSPPSPPSANSLEIELVRVLANAELHYIAPTGDDSLLQRGGLARLRVDGALHLAGEETKVTLAALTVTTELPVRATVNLTGVARLEGAELTVEKARAEVESSGEELGLLVPSALLTGTVGAQIEADGPMTGLTVHAAIKPAQGTLDARGALALHGSDLTWSGHASGRKLDPGAVTAISPHGTVEFDADGSGRNGVGTVKLARLDATALDAHAEIKGESDLTGCGKAEIAASAKDLSRLVKVGVPGLSGSATAHIVAARTPEHLTIDARMSGTRLQREALRVASLTATVHAIDYLGDLKLEAEGFRAGAERLDAVHLSAHADRHAGAIHLDAKGAEKTAFAIDLRGKPLWKGTTPIGADAHLERLFVTRRGERWESRGTAHVRVDSRLTLERLFLTSGVQRIALDAGYGWKDQSIEATLKTQKVDVAKVMALVMAPPKFPHTSVDAEARVSGTIARPVIAASIAASAKEVASLGDVEMHLQALYSGERMRGELTLSSLLSAKSPKVSKTATVNGRFDVPASTRGDAPLSLALTTKGLSLAMLHSILPAAVADLAGKVELQVRAAGTLGAPNFALNLRAADWQLGDATVADKPMKSDTVLAVTYKGGVFGIHETTRLGGGAGEVDADLALPVDLRRAIANPAHALSEIMSSAPLQASLAAIKVDLARLPFEYVGLTRPVSTGVIDAAMKLSGTMDAPELHLKAQAKGLAREAVVDQVDLSVTLDLVDKRAQVVAGVDLRGQRLLDATGQATLDVPQIIAGQAFREQPIQLEVRVPGFDLARLRGMQPELATLAGKLEAAIHVTGNLVKQLVDGSAEVSGLQLAEARFNRFALKGDFDGQRVKAQLDAAQTDGGTLHFDGAVPLDKGAPWQLAFQATRFDLKFLSGTLSDLRSAKGVLDATVAITGSRGKPNLEAHAAIKGGGFQLRVDPHPYEKIELDARVHAGAFDLASLKVTSGDGTLSAHGHADLVGFMPTKGEFEAETHRFALVMGSMAAWLNSNLGIHIEGNAKQVHARVEIKNGVVHLPKIAASRSLQPLGPPPRVVFVDRQARKAANAKAAAERGETMTEDISVHIPGPFYVRSKEANVELKGDLQLAITGGEVSLTGTAETSTGWIELLDQRYNIDHARVGFSGPPEDPNLDIRISRELREAVIVAEVHGTGTKPELELFSDPPIYDKSQILGIILSGDPAGQQVSDRGLDQKVVGAVSGLVLGKIKDTLAPSLPIDVLHVQTGDSGYTGLVQTEVEVGKFLTENLYVSYVHQFGQPSIAGASNSNEARAEYRFKRRYELDTSFGDAGVAGVDLFWTIRY